MKKYFNKGFTLAEVLITLAIIGVVAAMTVPTLMTSTRGKEYEVGATKAMSTIANAMSMRYAMDGVALADYNCPDCPNDRYNLRLFKYLTSTPGNRPGEKPALLVTGESINDVDNNADNDMPVYKMADGMLLIVPIWLGGNSACGGGVGGIHYVAVDTNGEKGPTRFNMDTRYSGNGNITGSNCNIDAGDIGLWTTLNNTKTGQSFSFRDANNENPTDNNNPDIVFFAVDPHTGTVKPAGRRTRNIMATGNAMISQ